MRIIKYEIFKILSKKAFLLIVSFMFITNLLLYYGEQVKSEEIFIDNKDAYYGLESNYREMTSEKALQEIITIKNELQSYQFLGGNNEYNNDFINEIEKRDPNIINRFSESVYKNNNEKLIVDSYFINLLFDQITYINGYSNYINSIKEKSENMVDISIFHNKGSFAYKNIIKTPKDFEHLKGIELKLGLQKGIVSATDFKLTDIFTLIIIFIMCIYLFVVERDLGLIQLIKSNKKGRVNVAIAKILTLVLGISIISILFYGSILLLSYIIYGFGDSSNYIQSLSAFRECTMLINIKGYLIIYILYKIITLILIGLILTLIFLLLKNTLEVYLVTLILSIISFISYIFIYPSSYINFIKYINIFYFLDVFKIISEYTNINIFGNAINSKSIYFTLTLIILIILITINCYIFCTRDILSKESIMENITNRIKYRLFRLRGTSSLFIQEFYKIIIYNKVYIIFMVIAVIIGNNVINSKKNFTTDEIIYKNYINVLKGEITDEKIDYIDDEKRKFDELEDKYGSIDRMQISDKEKYIERNKLDIIKPKKIIFDDIIKQYEYLINLKNENKIDGEFVDIISYNNLFNDDRASIVNGIILAILIIMCLANIFSIDFKNKSINILGCTKYGFTRGIIYKYLISIGIILFIAALFIISRYIEIYRLYELDNLEAPIQSIYKYYNFPLKLSILNFIVLKEILMILGLFTMASVILLISVIVKNYSISIIISISLIIIPMILNLISIDILNLISFNNIFMLNDTLDSSKGIVYNLIYYFILICELVISIYLTSKLYKNKRIILKKVLR